MPRSLRPPSPSPPTHPSARCCRSPCSGAGRSPPPSLIAQAGFGRPWAVGVAAFGIGLFGYTVGRRFRVPPLVVVVSAVVPLLPGLTIYRGLFLLGEQGGQQAAQGLLAMVTAASVAIALASGVILGEYVAQPVMREARRVEARLAGPRLVGVTRSVRKRRGSREPEG
ncbi:threonine/serine exporter family protein [Nocardioides convexus]|uniref:threonine/serine exporter family protein n=1 Tax=Nocardioides convexus TaxID=2712224 RepID=UPI0024183DFB|nr:threonine/serine exporter family protein [Nocardioides convexus]